MEELILHDSTETAKRLLGAELLRSLPEGDIRVKIIEVELYRQDDAASHSFNGSTQRTSVMFGPPAHAYVYFTYGMHYCFNITIGPMGRGAALLVRAVEPLSGAKIMAANRPIAKVDSVLLSNGPAKLCQALRIDKSVNSHALDKPPLQLILHDPIDESEIVTTKRIGISKAVDMPWRFYIDGNRYVSKK